MIRFRILKSTTNYCYRNYHTSFSHGNKLQEKNVLKNVFKYFWVGSSPRSCPLCYASQIENIPQFVVKNHQGIINENHNIQTACICNKKKNYFH